MSSDPKLSDLLAAKDARKRGAGHHSAKLTAAKVHTIRQALARGVAAATIARLYGVSRQAICQVRDGVTWKN